MPRKVFQDFANTLPAMFVGWRMASDLETLAELPDGTLTIDVKRGTAAHTSAPAITLHIAAELQAWLRARFEALSIPSEQLDSAILVARISTDRIATDRKRIVAFSIECKATLISSARSYVGSLSERHVWHNRMSPRMSDSRKSRAAKIQGSIRQVLRHDWNPIGFAEHLPEDDYDSYIAPVYRILAGSRSEQELIECLLRLESDIIGVPCESPEQLRPVAQKLLELDVRL
jgi:hypothetical protein